MPGSQEQRHVYYDRDLEIEAYQLSGIVQKFPNHFHEFYVIGFVEGGRRRLWCNGQEYRLRAGDLVLFNPRDSHCCAPVGGELLDYRAVNIPAEVVSGAAKEIWGYNCAPRFTQSVVYQSELAASVGAVYDAILADAPKLQKEEAFFSCWNRSCRNMPLCARKSETERRTIKSKCSATIWSGTLLKTLRWTI